MLGNFSCFCCLLTFSKFKFSGTCIRVSNNFDPDHSVGGDLLPNCFQRLSAHDMIKDTSSKERVTVNSETFARVLFSRNFAY